MGDLIKIVRESNTVELVVKTLQENKEKIKDIFAALRLNDGRLLIVDADVPFETLCTVSKKLDLLIDYRQQDEEIIDEELDSTEE